MRMACFTMPCVCAEFGECRSGSRPGTESDPGHQCEFVPWCPEIDRTQTNTSVEYEAVDVAWADVAHTCRSWRIIRTQLRDITTNVFFFVVVVVIVVVVFTVPSRTATAAT